MGNGFRWFEILIGIDEILLVFWRCEDVGRWNVKVWVIVMKDGIILF